MSKGSGPKMFTIKLCEPKVPEIDKNKTFARLEKELDGRKSEIIRKEKYESQDYGCGSSGITHAVVSMYDLGDGVKIIKDKKTSSGFRPESKGATHVWRSSDPVQIEHYFKESFNYFLTNGGKVVDNIDEAIKLVEQYTGVKLHGGQVMRSGCGYKDITYKLSTEAPDYFKSKK